ncbi:hypothetical protein BFG51_15935 [Dietzia alimentaria]|nr:hypothetical protein BFG51_15935 [Dietzia alimentaria]
MTRVPMRSAAATRTTPTKATVSTTAHHRRWVSQAGIPTRSKTAKNGPCGNRYPYAWFCTWPEKDSPVHRWVAWARKRPGSTTRSYLVSGTTRPGDCRHASRRKARNATTASRAPAPNRAPRITYAGVRD